MNILDIGTDKRDIFGTLDALDENDVIFKSYFLETNIFKKIAGKSRFFILVGEKGTGKSALLKRCMIADKEKGLLVIKISRPQVNESANINDMINKWKDILANEIFKSLDSNEKTITESVSTLGAIKNSLETVFTEYVKAKYDINYVNVKQQVLSIFNSTDCDIKVYIDDLDVGYKGTQTQNESIIALFTAIRELIRDNASLKFRVTLRTDVYDNIRRLDESADKIQDAKLELKISNHEILAMLTKRVLTLLGKQHDNKEDYKNYSQAQMMSLMNDLFEERFYGRGIWENIATYRILMTMTRRRPRDLFVLCGLAWDSATNAGRTKITSSDLSDNFIRYSNERLSDEIAEYRHEFKNNDDFKELVLSLKPSRNQRRNHKEKYSLYLYDKYSLLKKIDTIIERRNFYFFDGKKAGSLDLAKFLYKANIIIGRKDTDTGIKRAYYMEQPDLISDNTDYGYKFEVHPAYRWAIDDNHSDVYNSITLEGE